MSPLVRFVRAVILLRFTWLARYSFTSVSLTNRSLLSLRNFILHDFCSFLHQKYRQVEGINRKRALEELVNYAKHSMTEDFSRQFDLVPDHGSNKAGNRLYLSINWKYFRVQSSPQSPPTWNATFPEIRKVSYEKWVDQTF